MKDNTDDIKPIKEDADAIKADMNETKGTVGEIKDDTGAIRKKVEECLTCGQKKTVVIASPAVISAPAAVFSAPVLPSCKSTCSTEGQTRCTPGCLTGDQLDVCVRSGNCLIWQRQDCTGGQYCDSGTCRTRVVVTVRNSQQGCQGRNIVWLDSNGNYSGTIKTCEDSTEPKCFGDALKERTVRMKCAGDSYCAKDGESAWRTTEVCSPECGCTPPKREAERVVERIVVTETQHESVPAINITNNNVNANNNINNNSVPAPVAAVIPQPQPEPVIAPPAPPAPPTVVGCTQNCTPPQVEGTNPVVYNPPPVLPAVPTVVGCTQNCTPSQVETTGNGSSGVVTPPPAAPVPPAVIP